MATPAHPSFGHLTPEEFAAAKAAPFGGAGDSKKMASRRRAALKAAATRAAKKGRS